MQSTEPSSGLWVCAGIFLLTWKDCQPADGKSSSRESVFLCHCKNRYWKSGRGKLAVAWLAGGAGGHTNAVDSLYCSDKSLLHICKQEHITPAHTKRQAFQWKTNGVTNHCFCKVQAKFQVRKTEGEKKCLEQRGRKPPCCAPLYANSTQCREAQIFSCGNKTRKTDLALRGF